MPTRASRSGCRSRGQPDLGERQQGGQFPRLLRFRHKESEATVAVRNPARGDKSPRCLQAKPCRAGLGILPDVSKRRWLGGEAPEGLCQKAARSFELRACARPSPSVVSKVAHVWENAGHPMNVPYLGIPRMKGPGVDDLTPGPSSAPGKGSDCVGLAEDAEGRTNVRQGVQGEHQGFAPTAHWSGYRVPRAPVRSVRAPGAMGAR